MKDYYKILGIDADASSDDIKKAYRKLALKWHPDKNPDNSEKSKARFQEISEAYGTLSDPVKKHQYDANARYGNLFTSIRFERGDSRFSGFSGFRSKRSNDVNEFYNNVFRNVKFRASSKSNEADVLDIHKTIDIDLKDLLSGNKFNIKIDKILVCKKCGGTGMVTCFTCGGAGYNIHSEEICKACKGGGKIPCSACGGREYTTEKSDMNIEISIRKHVVKINYESLTGTYYVILRYQGFGNQKRNYHMGFDIGNLYIRADIIKPEHIDIVNHNIIHHVYYKLHEVLKNKEFILESIDKRKFKIKLNNFNYLNDIKATIPNLGARMPDGTIGDYVFKINIIAPDLTKLSNKELADFMKMIKSTY